MDAKRDWLAELDAWLGYEEPNDKCKNPGAQSEGIFPPRALLEIGEDQWNAACTAPRCIVEDYLYADVAVKAAPGGAGKTTLELFEMIHITLGRPLYGLEVRSPGWCLLITAEDPRTICVARLRELCRGLGLSGGEEEHVRRNVAIIDATAFDMKLARIEGGNVVLSADVQALINAYKGDPPVVVTIDPVASFEAGEGKVNENEQGLINAARRIRTGLGCCVRLLHHTGKTNAREKALDQYAARGGSALSDGARMVTVLQTWEPAMGLQLPAGWKAEADASFTILARPKLSYARPGLPRIWLRREGWKIEHHVEEIVSREEKGRATREQIVRFLLSEEAAGRSHSKHSLEAAAKDIKLNRQELRDGLAILMAEGRVCKRPLPRHLRQGGRQYAFAVV